MPQPRRASTAPAPRRRGSQRPRQPPAPPPDQGVTAGQVAAAAALTALAAQATPTPSPAAPAAAAVQAATSTLMAALETLFRRRRSELPQYVRTVVEQERPDAPASRVAELVGQEQQRELEFQRRSRSRVQAQLKGALRDPDADSRAKRVAQIMKQEKHYLAQRESAVASRVVAALEFDLLRKLSPEGAYWKLSPLVREHTPDCIAMGGKFWPWEVLDEIHPQLHPGCQCQLLTKDEAVSQGLMLPDQVPDTADAVRRAKAIADEVRRLQETMDPDELAAAVRELEDMRILEARAGRKALRWAAGTVKGGEFRPTRGGDRGAISKAELLARQLKLGDLRGDPASGVSRTVHIRGQRRDVPEAEYWDERIQGNRYTSPAGGTNIYRNGVLIGDDHPDLAAPGKAQYAGANPQVAPSKIDQPNARVTNQPEPPGDGIEPSPAPHPQAGIPDYTGTSLKIGDRAGGSTGARWAFDAGGHRWLVKTYNGNQDRVATELLANAIYREMGARAADAGVMRLEGEPDFAQIQDTPLAEPPLPGSTPGDKVALQHTKFVGGKPTVRISTGIIVREPDGSIWVYEPKGHFGGYEHTFPKGGLEKGLTPQQNAHKELWEETGLHAHITGYVGDFKGTTGVTRYYLASRTGGTPHPDDPTPYKTGGSETAAVKRLTPEEARKALNTDRDQKILDAVLAMDVPEGGQPDKFPPPTQGLALAYPTLDGEVRDFKYDKGGKAPEDPWGGPSRKLGEHYMTDALLANWDFVGLTRDNVLWTPDPEDPEGELAPIRIDQGGTLQFRAQGQPKPFGPIPSEVWSLRSPKGQGFDTVAVTDGDLRRQARTIGDRLTNARVDELVNQAPFGDEVMREEVRQALKDRIDWMRQFTDGAVDVPRPLEGQAARKELKLDQAQLDVMPEEHEALDDFANGGWSAVNTHLRSGAPKPEATDEVAKTVKHLDVLLKHARLDNDVYAYTSFNPDNYPPPEEMVGRTLKDPAFATGVLSAAPLRKKPGLLRLTLPAGSRAVYVQGVEGLEDSPRNVEMVLGRGSRMRVVRATTEDGQMVMEAVLLP